MVGIAGQVVFFQKLEIVKGVCRLCKNTRTVLVS